MHLHFERNTNAKCDCTILYLTWMGKVPDEVPEDEGWKLNRVNYYQEGWLATGNARGIVGITFTTSHCQQPTDSPLRTNYNLRGHRSQVVLVKWNEPYQKLASCDSSGVIFVWVKYEGRWSIELINDRNTPVTHFAWSHDGRMAVICYRDGFVLVGSVGGQRYWSSMLNVESTVTCGLWTPDDQQVYFGTSAGQIIVMDVTGAMVSEVPVPMQVGPNIGITGMAWSCEKFKMEESDDAAHNNAHPDGRPFVLAVSMECGIISLLKQYDDMSPTQIRTYLSTMVIEWSNSGELLAVAGVAGTSSSPGQMPQYYNVLKFYSDTGKLLHSVTIPGRQCPVTALTWGHNDKRLFIATGREVHIAWVSRRIASLQMLCRLRIHRQLRGGEGQLAQLMLPPQVHDGLAQLFSRTIRCCVPDFSALREFVSQPPKSNVRLHCTMIRHDEDGSCYTLYLEYLGGLVPLLKGKRTSKIRPEFVIFDPIDDTSAGIGECRFAVTALPPSAGPRYDLPVNGGGTSGTTPTAMMSLSVLSPYRNDFEESDSEREEGCVSPRMQRKCQRARARTRFRFGNGLGRGLSPELTYVDTLPEDHTLVQVTSNIWGTKFKIHGLAGGTMPVNLGHITYKTSLLHLQPRQMTVCVTEMRTDLPASLTNDPNFNPNVFSEDEEEACGESNGRCMPVPDACPPIAPMLTPRNPRRASRASASGVSGPTSAETSSHPYQPPAVTRVDVGTQARCNIGINFAALARAESYTDDDFPYPSFSEPLQRPVADSIRLGCAAPTLQSPKNSVAPLVSAPTAPDYSVNLHRLKTVLEGANNVSGCQHYLFQTDRSEDFTERKPPPVGPFESVQSSGGTSVHSAPVSSATVSSAPVSSAAVSSAAVSSAAVSSAAVSSAAVSSSAVSSSAVSSSAVSSSAVSSSAVSSSAVSSATVVPPAVSSAAGEGATLPCGSHTLASLELRFIDDESHEIRVGPVRSCSVGFLNQVTTGAPVDTGTTKRLVLTTRKVKERTESKIKTRAQASEAATTNGQIKTRQCSKSRSLDVFPGKDVVSSRPSSSSPAPELRLTEESNEGETTADTPKLIPNGSPPIPDSSPKPTEELPSTNGIHADSEKAVVSVEDEVNTSDPGRTRTESTLNSTWPGGMSPKRRSPLANATAAAPNRTPEQPVLSPRLPRSTPSSPATSKRLLGRNLSSSPIKQCILNSPLLLRRIRRNRSATESTDDEEGASGDDHNYSDLETFQKAQLRQKLSKAKRGKHKTDFKKDSCTSGSVNDSNSIQKRAEFVMHNKAPMWNENSQVYQLDFGGRVTQESAKNFQIEFRSKQVMQFGRIDGNAYTLDFQYPFSALQAFAVALANVTQRLK